MTLSVLQFILASEGTAVCSPRLRTLALARLLSLSSLGNVIIQPEECNNYKRQEDRIFFSLPLHKQSYQAGMFASAAAPWLGGCLSLQNCGAAKYKWLPLLNKGEAGPRNLNE